MSIRRVGAQVLSAMHKTIPNQGMVVLEVNVEGTLEDRSDCLLMIADAWVQLMTEAGFDPDKSFAHMRNHGRLN